LERVTSEARRRLEATQGMAAQPTDTSAAEQGTGASTALSSARPPRSRHGERSTALGRSTSTGSSSADARFAVTGRDMPGIRRGPLLPA
jgi:hypothetical protein